MVLILLLFKEAVQLIFLPSPNYILEQEDILVVVGSNKQIQILEAKRYGK